MHIDKEILSPHLMSPVFFQFDSGDMPQDDGAAAADQNPGEDQAPAVTSQPGSAKSARGSRPVSGRPTSGRPKSGRPQTGDELHGSERPQSGRPQSGRPGSGQAQDTAQQEPEEARSSRPTSGRPKSGAAGGSSHPSRHGSAASRKSVAERIAEDADQMGKLVVISYTDYHTIVLRHVSVAGVDT